MGATFSRRVQAAFLSLMILGSVSGCAGGAQPRGAGDTGGVTGGAAGGAGTTAGGGGGAGNTTGAGSAGGGGAAGGMGGAAGGGMAAGAAQGAGTDLGQQISHFVARMGGVGGGGGGGLTTGRMGLGGTAGRGAGGGGAAAAGNVGVSTLVIENLAFVGLDMSTVTGGGGAGAGGSPGGAMGGATGAGGATGGTTTGPGLEDRIRNEVRAAFPQVDEVYVTTSPGMVYRIARITGDVQAGVSTAPRLSEIFSIATAMAGTTGGSR
ncbi:MAG TPA: hypothetical protein VD902_09405 [Symbiobacteriaceae bacterium]|nr:hypothetical protein [Symbiobacteriaceae bacterium]